MSEPSIVISEALRSVLPSLPQQELALVVQKLLDIGVDTLDDLQHVKESDFDHLLRPTQARKPLLAWSQPRKSL